jgi:hypothetical protein
MFGTILVRVWLLVEVWFPANVLFTATLFLLSSIYIYFVLIVHYSTVTADVARLASDFGPNETYIHNVHSTAWTRASPEVFLDELTQGTLVHTKSVLPHETMYRGSICQLNSTLGACALGFECPAHVEFSDQAHQKNIFQNDYGEYCNCWINPRVEQVFAPKLKAALEEHLRKMMSR